MIESVVTFAATTLTGLAIGLVGKIFIDMNAQREATKSLLRSEMVKSYYKYKEQKAMPYYAKEAWYSNFEEYRKLKGNSFVEDMKHEIDEWDIY
jgi:hypothetical protein